MLGYLLRRLLLIPPTLLAIITLNFLIVQAAPGGPVEQAIAKASGLTGTKGLERISGQGAYEVREKSAQRSIEQGAYRGALGLDPKIIEAIEKRFGFDKPLHERYFQMLKDFFLFNFGDSFFRGDSVMGLVRRRLPVSISLGLWTFLLVYGISIPLGIRKAVREGTAFDFWTSTALSVGNAIPAFLFAIFLIVLFAGGSFWNIFPLRGLVSENWGELSWGAKIADYFWHMTLPLLSLVIGSFAGLSLFTKNNFLEELSKQYVVTARAKGNTERAVLWGHVFRNGMLLVISGFPSAFIGIFFTGSVIIETIFSIEGLGLLGYTATLQRDYPVMFGTLYVFTLLGLATSLISDLVMMLVDPRLDFRERGKR